MSRSPVRSPAPRNAARRKELGSARRPVETAVVRDAGRRARELDPQAKLWRAYRKRRGAAERNALVVNYQRLVGEHVRRFAARLPRSVDPGDLATAANVGLMAAVESFDPTRGVPFESYCELRIRGALLDELRSLDWLPRPWRARIERHKRVLEELRSGLGREPFDEDVCAALEVSLDDYRAQFGSELQAAASPSLGASVDSELSSLEIADSSADAPVERLSREELLALVAQKLSPQEYRIVYLRYWEDLPMREIGELEGLSESRVWKIHAKLLERLQERFRA
jgi:RNA polymerase sigma factor for flagellar operon FliA